MFLPGSHGTCLRSGSAQVYGLCFSCGEEAATFASHASLSARESLPPPRAAPLPPAARMAPPARSGGGGGGLLSNIFGRKKDKNGGRVQTSPALPGQQLKTAPPAAAVAVTARNGCGIAGGNPADTTTAGARGVPRRYAPAAEPVPVLRHVGWDEELGFSVGSLGPTNPFSLPFLLRWQHRDSRKPPAARQWKSLKSQWHVQRRPFC